LTSVAQIFYDHNAWNYLWYLLHCARTKYTDLTAQQKYYLNKVTLSEPHIFPIGRAKSLQVAELHGNDHKQDQLRADVQQLRKDLSELTALISNQHRRRSQPLNTLNTAAAVGSYTGVEATPRVPAVRFG